MRNDESSGAAQACLTAAVAGNYAEARRLRLQVLVDALEELTVCEENHCECRCPGKADRALRVMEFPIPDEET